MPSNSLQLRSSFLDKQFMFLKRVFVVVTLNFDFFGQILFVVLVCHKERKGLLKS